MAIENLLPDIPRYLTGLAEWLACLVIIVNLKQRVQKSRLILYAIGMLSVQIGFLMATENVPIIFWVPCMVLALGFMIFFIWLTCRMTKKGACFLGMLAFIIAEFVAALEWQVYCYLVLYNPSSFLTVLLFYGIIYLIFWKLLNLNRPEEEVYDIEQGEVISSAIILAFVFTFSNLSFLTMGTPFSSFRGEAVATIRMVSDFAGVAILFGRYIDVQKNKILQERNFLQSMLEHQYQQYQLTEESVNLINFKYHDLKHQMTLLRAEEDEKKREEYLKRMEEEIGYYEMQHKTGNRVLDTILTSKSMICDRDQIHMNCVANGEKMNFIDPIDLSGLIGNALDNAIEYERGIVDSDKRIIDIAIFAQEQMLIMRFANYYEGGLLEENQPLTSTKDNSGFHGYGIKSIQYTVKKYNGTVKISTDETWFELKILIPIPTEKMTL